MNRIEVLVKHLYKYIYIKKKPKIGFVSFEIFFSFHQQQYFRTEIQNKLKNRIN
jgi:hypothetical protein